ncbi:hypothetical protein P4U97_06530 [Bacillus swezeyi]|uniref:hypothetical protein n=1 Tax=Bacillus swezeyi TaxID=1925020 RepID=UPI002E1C3301|nr:hypothetical protein [Bacillus swezeyi]
MKFELLENWLSSDPSHLTLYIGGITVIALASIAILIIFKKKIGMDDERSCIINLKINNAMFSSLILLLVFFTLWMPNNLTYYKYYLGIPIVLSVSIGAITSIRYYLRQIG